MKLRFILSLLICTFVPEAFASVDCVLKRGESTTLYRRIDLGMMVGHFTIHVLQSGVLIPQKTVLNLSCDGGEMEPAKVCTVGFSNASELVQVGGFARAKTLNQMEFSALIPQSVTLSLGDVGAGEDCASLICTVK